MFPAEVTQIFSAYIGLLLQQFQANPAANWRAKDTAIVLVIALAVKTSTASVSFLSFGSRLLSFLNLFS